MAMVSAEVKDDSASPDLNNAASAEGKGEPVEAVKKTKLKTKRMTVTKGYVKKLLVRGPRPKPNLSLPEEVFQDDTEPEDQELLEAIAGYARLSMFFHKMDMAILKKYLEKGYDVDEVEVEIEDGDEDFLSSLD